MRVVPIGAVVAAAIWLNSSSIAAGATCGNNIVEPPEECDVGGFCVDSNNAGTPCTAPSDCQGGQCKTFGGTGCAANCTLEHDVPFNLVPGVTQGFMLEPGTSGVSASTFIQLPLPLSGNLVLTVGKEVDGQIPVVIKAASVSFPAIAVLGVACGCVHGATAKTCGGTVFEDDGQTLSKDCTPGFSNGDSVCDGDKPCAFVHGAGNTASGVIGCDGLDGINISYAVDAGGESDPPTPQAPVITINGSGGPGSASIATTIGVSVVLGACTGTSADYGPDGLFCTADDMASLGAAATLPAVTGTATAVVTNEPDGSELGPVTVTGVPFSCSALANGDTAGGSVVSAFAFLGLPTVGDLAVTVDLVSQGTPAPTPTATPGASSCPGDCDGSGDVSINEIITLVDIALGSSPVSDCPVGDTDNSGDITINEIIAAVNAALNGCPS